MHPIKFSIALAYHFVPACFILFQPICRNLWRRGYIPPPSTRTLLPAGCSVALYMLQCDVQSCSDAFRATSKIYESDIGNDDVAYADSFSAARPKRRQFCFNACTRCRQQQVDMDKIYTSIAQFDRLVAGS